MPKGKHMCSCGEIIRTTGEDLNDFPLSEVKISFKDRLPSLLEIQIIFAIIIIVGFFVLRVIYQDSWVQAEADFMYKTFGIEREFYKLYIARLGIAAIICIWLFYKLYKKIKGFLGFGYLRKRKSTKKT